MLTQAAIFKSGNSQAIRLPKKFQMRGKRVTLELRGGALIVRELPTTMAQLMQDLPHLPDAPLNVSYEGDVDAVPAW
jgi:antitoxin VapB